jgi:glycosyltransferase involved in cell wall biosynthesis
MADRSMLLFERGFLRPRRRKPVHGVELFRLQMLRTVLDLGVQVTVLAERSWAARIRSHIGQRTCEIITVPNLFHPELTAAALAYRLGRRRFQTLLLGDPDRRSTRSVARMLDRHVADRVVVASHGMGREPVMQTLAGSGAIIVCNSDAVADHWRRGYDGQIDVSYGIVDSERFTPRVESKPSPVIRFGVVAKLPGMSKGIDVAAEAYLSLPQTVRSATELHLAGYVKTPPPQPRGIIAHRWIPYADIPAFMRELDVLIVPSTWESFSQAAAQGMLTGLPLLVSGLSVLAEKVQGGAGLVCHNTQELTSAMEQLASDQSLRARMGAAARESALRRYVFDPRKYCERFLWGG